MSNLLTVAQATTNHCPQAHLQICRGPTCMAWRFTGRAAQPTDVVEGLDRPTDTPDNHEWVLNTYPAKWGLFPLLGYCGLGGKP